MVQSTFSTYNSTVELGIGNGFLLRIPFWGGARAGQRGGIISSEAHQHVADVKGNDFHICLQCLRFDVRPK